MVISGTGDEENFPPQNSVYKITITSPTPGAAKNLDRVCLKKVFRYHNNGPGAQQVDYSIPDSMANRASAVTLFERKRDAADQNYSFRMLFCADAFDRHCAIRDTVTALITGQVPRIDVDFLKVRTCCFSRLA